MAKLTDATIRALPVPPKGNKITYDDLPGFGVRVTAAGARSFILNYLTKRPGAVARVLPGPVAPNGRPWR